MTSHDHILTVIAREHLDIETLETRRSDSLDFHDVAVWSVKEALLAAYQAGANHRPAHDLLAALSTIAALCNSPDWTPERRWKMERIASMAIAKAKDE